MILQNILRQNSPHLKAGSGWHSFKLQLNQSLSRVRTESYKDQRFDSELRAQALQNVRIRLKSQARQEYLIPKRFSAHKYQSEPASSCLEPASCSEERKRNISKPESSISTDSTHVIAEIKKILGSVFSNVSEVLVAFGAAEKDFITPMELIMGLKGLGLQPLLIAYALKDLKFCIEDGKIDTLQFLKLFDWVGESTDQQLMQRYFRERRNREKIEEKFTTTIRRLASKKNMASNYRLILNVLRRNLEVMKRHLLTRQPALKITNPIKALKRQIMSNSMGLKYDDLETAFAILSEISTEKHDLDDVELFLNKYDIEHSLEEKSETSAEGFQRKIFAKDLLLVPGQHTSRFAFNTARRPHSARNVPQDRQPIAARPRTARTSRSILPWQPLPTVGNR